MNKRIVIASVLALAVLPVRISPNNAVCWNFATLHAHVVPYRGTVDGPLLWEVCAGYDLEAVHLGKTRAGVQSILWWGGADVILYKAIRGDFTIDNVRWHDSWQDVYNWQGDWEPGRGWHVRYKRP